MKTKTSGKFRQLSNGTWSIDTRVKVDGEYKHLTRRGYRTLTDAKNDYENVLANFIKEVRRNKDISYFEDLVDEYEEMRKLKVTNTTILEDISIFNTHLIPAFKNKLLKNCLTESCISDYYKKLINNKSLSDNRKSKIITRLKDLLKFAYMHKYMDVSTYQDCDIQLYNISVQKKAKIERTIWTDIEERNFFECIKKTNLKDYVMFKVFIATACRIGEFLALQGKCYDKRNHKVNIFQQYVRTEEGDILCDRLKTHDSYRSIVLPLSICNLLNDYISEFNIKDDDFLFYSTNKKRPISRTDFRRKLYRYCEIAEVPKMNPHASRHQQAVKLAKVSKNINDIIVASKRLGHSPEMFLNTYANHSYDDEQNELLDRIV